MRIRDLRHEFKLIRYNKSDWNGYYIRKFNAAEGMYGIYYFTVDCRQRVDKVNEVLLILKEWEDEKSNEQ